MDEFRNFDPTALQIIPDRDEVDRTVVQVGEREQSWPAMAVEKQSQLLHKHRLDGLLIASDTMKIGKNSKSNNKQSLFLVSAKILIFFYRWRFIDIILSSSF